MSRPIAAALVLAAMALLASASAIAQAAPAPGELWSEFPLEPVTATTPAGLAPAQGGEQPVQPQDTAAGTDARTEWVVLLLGAVAAGAAGLVTRHRRSAKRQQPGPEGERKQERAVVHTFERAVSSRASDRGTGSVMIKGRTRTRTATQPMSRGSSTSSRRTRSSQRTPHRISGRPARVRRSNQTSLSRRMWPWSRGLSPPVGNLRVTARSGSRSASSVRFSV
jgi:hypothetical protein